jgi:hypothetical protein
MAGMMTARKLSNLLTQLPAGTMVFLMPNDKLFIGPHAQEIKGYFDFQNEELVMQEHKLLANAQGDTMAAETNGDPS